MMFNVLLTGVPAPLTWPYKDLMLVRAKQGGRMPRPRLRRRAAGIPKATPEAGKARLGSPENASTMT